MFYNTQPKKQIDRYVGLLQKVGSLSNLFSSNPVPLLYYRTAENIFCKAFEADNHSRSDTAADAGKKGVGVGIKTFMNQSGTTFQKIAEFNRKQNEYRMFQDKPEKLVPFISELRNKRIDFAKSAHGLENMIYHCVAREKGKFLVFEEPMNYIDTSKITKLETKGKSIFFSDGKEEYKFYFPKSTLFKRFVTQNTLVFDVSIIEDPYEFLDSLDELDISPEPLRAVYLPLYSSKSDGTKHVPEKSGLNQWNASGRPRDNREVYIRIPLWIHRVYEGFFPPKDEPFNLKLPDGKVLSAKVCQQGGKALMSNPNKALGEWLIDKVLKIKPGSIVTYDLLDSIGTDSVEVRKTANHDFEIDFKSSGTFEAFETASLKKN